jgi:hypothetical protein
MKIHTSGISEISAYVMTTLPANHFRLPDPLAQ